MSITRIKSDELLLKRLKPEHPRRFLADDVIFKFNPLRRSKQIAFAKQGDVALREVIKNADKLEENNRLKITCFFSFLKGDMKPLGMLASYYDKGRTRQLWWTPEKGD